MTIKCDVLVVGAGPAGSSAARAATLFGVCKEIKISKNQLKSLYSRGFAWM